MALICVGWKLVLGKQERVRVRVRVRRGVGN